MSLFSTHTLTITRTSGKAFVSEVKSSVATAITNVNSNILYTAKGTGIEGDGIKIDYVNPSAPSQSLSVTVSGKTITVNLATDVSSNITTTATLLKARIELTSTALALVTPTLVGDGSGILEALSVTTSGGVNPTQKGYYSAGTDTTFTAVGNLQPGNKDDLQKLPEGLRNRDIKLFMTKTEIKLNDKASINSENYTAMIIEDFSEITNVGRYEIIFVKDRGQ